MKLYHSPTTPFGRKVMVHLIETGQAKDVTVIAVAGTPTSPGTMPVDQNPLGKIPALVTDEGEAIYDSRVICEYLNDLGGGTLFPREGIDKWQALRWHAFGDGLLDAAILWRNERERLQPLQTLIDAFDLKTRTSLRQLDDEAQALAETPFSIGHIAVACALGYLDYRFDALGWRSHAPRLAEWEADLRKRPSMQQTEPIDG